MATLELLFTKIPIKTEKQTLKSLDIYSKKQFINAKEEICKHSVQELWKNFTEYRLSMEAQKSYEKEKKLVADFGAKIETIATDVESMKDHYNGISEKQENLQTVFNNLKAIGY
ncbi:hypothetical protein GQX74_013644 [Glossina fuscipes]|nr:hypothetical protein GQX74_013644 [Glossina fuscipes]